MTQKIRYSKEELLALNPKTRSPSSNDLDRLRALGLFRLLNFTAKPYCKPMCEPFYVYDRSDEDPDAPMVSVY